MKYVNPKMNITKFDSIIKTEGGMPTMAPVSANYNEATKTLTERFEEASANAAEVLVYRWE